MLPECRNPVPSFVMVARAALAVSRRDGLAAAMGMGVGGILSLLGIKLIVEAQQP